MAVRRNEEDLDISQDGTKKHWALILGRVYKVFYYKSRDEAYDEIAKAFRSTYGTQDDREVGEIYRLRANEWRLVEMYYDIDGKPAPNPAINDQGLPWSDRRILESPSIPGFSAYTFIGSWIQGCEIKHRELSFFAENYERALNEANVAMRRILKVRRLPETSFQLKYIGSSK